MTVRLTQNPASSRNVPNMGAAPFVPGPALLYAVLLLLLSLGITEARAQEWTLSREPLLSIGTLEGPEVYQLFRVSGAHRLGSGGVGIVNAGSRDIRFFGPDGRHLASFGRQGGGPEEFEMPALAGSLGDTLIIVDQAHHRLTLVHPEDGFLGLARISDEVGGFLNPVGSFRNGETVYGGAFDMRRIREIHNGMNRAHTFYRSARLDGSMGTDFGDMAGAEFFIKDLEGSGPDARPALIPFGKVPVATTTPDHLFYSDLEDWTIQVFHRSGARTGAVTREWVPVSVADRDGRRFIEETLERIDDPAQQAQYRQYLEGLPLPEHFPPIGALLGDLEGLLWVQDYQRPGQESRSWSIIDSAGVEKGRLTFPERFHPLEIGRDYVLGLALDEMDVEYVQLYRLNRPR